jgi:glyoxylase-like metal-dependent hydrolase (beta-lactamase superfamily II)
VASSERLTFHFNGEDVSYMPLKPSHTNGDVAVYFHGSDVFAFGDVFTTDYPGIGIAEGGTENFVDNYNLALQMTTPKTIFVPGHPQLSKPEDVIAVRDAITAIHARFLEMAQNGMTLEQIMQARPSKEFDARFATENFSPNEMQNSTALVSANVCRSESSLGTALSARRLVAPRWLMTRRDLRNRAVNRSLCPEGSP